MSLFRYKDHAKMDTKSKLIDTCEFKNAEVHDSQVTENLLRHFSAMSTRHLYGGRPCKKY